MQIIGIDDTLYRAVILRISFESLDNKKVIKCELPQGHLFFKTLGYDPWGFSELCNIKDFSGLPKFRIHVIFERLENRLIAWEKIE